MVNGAYSCSREVKMGWGAFRRVTSNVLESGTVDGYIGIIAWVNDMMADYKTLRSGSVDNTWMKWIKHTLFVLFFT